MSKSVGLGPGEHQMAAKQHLVLKDKPSRSQPSISKNRKKSRIFRRPSLRCLGTFYRDGKFQSRDLVLIRDETSRPELVVFIVDYYLLSSVYLLAPVRRLELSQSLK